MTDTNTTESESETDNSQLTERVKKLEAQVESQQSTIERLMPSRRDVLKAGAGGLVGAVALSGSSSASTGSAGTIGSASDRPDIFADTVDTRSISGDYLYASGFSGGDADTRLDNALNTATDGSTIYLEPEDYSDAFTFSTIGLNLIGASTARTRVVSTTWDWNVGQGRFYLGTRSASTINIGGDENFARVRVVDDLTVAGIRNHVLASGTGSVTIDSGANNNIVIANPSLTVSNNSSSTTVIQ